MQMTQLLGTDMVMILHIRFTFQRSKGSTECLLNLTKYILQIWPRSLYIIIQW